MADTPTKVIVDCSTGQQEVVPLTADEIAEMEAARLAAEAAAELAAEEERAKATAKADLLEKLGISEDEAKLLLS